MKLKIKLLFVLAFTLITSLTFGQVPQKINYQGIARDSKGNPISKQKMNLKISVLPTQDATVAEYEETQLITTNEFGLYTLQIGNGTPISGEMKTVKWETGNKYIRVAIDQKGGNDFVDLGTTQLLSVPYAIYADKAGIARETVEGTDKTRTGTVSSNAAHVAGDANYISKFTALNTIGKSLLYDNGTNVGIGTTTPAAKFQITNTVAAVQEHIRMQNLSNSGAGRFTMYNDGVSSYATFTKYGSAYAGGYAGVATLYPYANLLAFGNNGVTAGDGNGRFLISSGGNIGISLFKGGVSKLKFHADYATENVGIGGNATPATNVHFNNSLAGDTLKITNSTTGHTATDGLDIRNTGNAAEIMNRENSGLSFGTNNTEQVRIDAIGNVGIGISSPTAKLHVKSSIKNDGVTVDCGDSMYVALMENGVYRGYVGSWAGDTADVDFGTGISNSIGSTHLTTQATPRLTVNSIGNVGIGTTNPTYKLEVDHGGSTGILVKSTSSFSVIDIDAASGDAALRFQRAGVNQWNVRNDPSTDNFQVFELGGGGERFQIQNTTGNVGINQTNPTAKLDIVGNVKINDGSQGAGKFLMSDVNGLATWSSLPATSAAGLDQQIMYNNAGTMDGNANLTFNNVSNMVTATNATISGLSGSGLRLATLSSTGQIGTSNSMTNNYIPKASASGTIANSQIQDNGTSLSVGLTTPSLLYQLYVYRQQLVANGDGQHSLFGYRTRDAQNDGTAYSQIGSNSATAGYNFWGDVYTFGTAGYSYNDYTRTGGVLGADQGGTYWGSLGYRSSGLVNYGVYGSSAYTSGTGYLPSNEVAGIGGGFFGNMIGSISKGKVIGQMNSGELFASYNLGDEYTSGKQIELVDNGTEKVAAYSVTSTELTIYKKGKINLVNGKAFVAFDKNYISLLADVPVVTITPMGACNGVYIESISKDGFTIKELNNGTSNVNISWISVADRIDNNSERVIPSEVLSNSFDINLQKTMHDDSNKENAPQGMWWDGETKNIKFGVMPASTYPARKEEDKNK